MSVNQDIPPEPRKIAPGDIVQVKGNVGPKMTVVGNDPERGAGHVECVYWDTSRDDCDRFESVFVHRDSLTVFDVAPPPGAIIPDFQYGGGQNGGLPHGAIGLVAKTGHVILDPLTPVGTVLYPQKIFPVAHPNSVIQTAVRNLKRMIEIRSTDASLMQDCLSVITDELYQHVDIAPQRG